MDLLPHPLHMLHPVAFHRLKPLDISSLSTVLQESSVDHSKGTVAGPNWGGGYCNWGNGVTVVSSIIDL